MDCLDKLVDSKFLRQIGTEIQIAKSKIIKLVEDCPTPGSLPISKKDKERKYNSYLKICGFEEEFVYFDPEDKHTLYYMNEGGILLISAQTKVIVDSAINQTLCISGDVPFYRKKKYINNKVYYFAMYDLAFRLPPITLN